MKHSEAWDIAERIHEAKRMLIDLQAELEEMGYALHFNKDKIGTYQPCLYKKYPNCIRKVKR